METPKDIINLAEQYRDFHFIPGNRYNPDVVEKIRLANALLIAVEAIKYCRAVPMWKTKDDAPQRLKTVFETCDEALSRIKSL